MIPGVVLTAPGGPDTPVPVGGLIGRLPTAALCVDAPTVSEAHALVSLRSGRLVLLGLRGALELEGQRVAKVVLQAGQRIGLGSQVILQVVALSLPGQVLAVEGLGPRPVVLVPGPWSVVPGPRLVQGHRPGALALIEARDAAWFLVVGDTADGPLLPGHTAQLPGASLRFVAVGLDQAGRPRTVGTDAPISLALHVQVWRELTRFTTADGRRLDLVGHPARILRELVLNAEPTHWEELASTIWEGRPVNLRDSWRRQLQVLRRKLRVAGIRTDLVRSLGDGRAMLDLRQGDDLDDRTFAAGDGPG